MEEEFKPLKPCFIGPIKVRSQSSVEAICPVVEIEIGQTGVVLMGYGNVVKLRNMCNYALSAGEWWINPKKPEPPKCLHIYDYADYTEIHTVCRKCGFKSPRPDPKWPDFKYHARPCKRGSMSHDWQHLDGYFGICKKCETIGITHDYYRWLLFEPIRTAKRAKIIANIIINDLMKHANEKHCKVKDLGLKSSDLAWLAGLITYGILDSTKISTAIDHFAENGGKIKEVIDELGLWSTFL